jgi:isocitrate lyase
LVIAGAEAALGGSLDAYHLITSKIEAAARKLRRLCFCGRSTWSCQSRCFHVIARGLAFAPYSDLLSLETREAGLR